MFEETIVLQVGGQTKTFTGKATDDLVAKEDALKQLIKEAEEQRGLVLQKILQRYPDEQNRPRPEVMG